jgi:hypothetical protein
MTPTASLDARFSSPRASPTPWVEAEGELERAGVYWLTTVRADGRPHVTTLIGVWMDGAMHVCTGPAEQKALAHNPHCIVTTGSNTYDHGLDVVVEGDAVRVTDDHRLRATAAAYVAKYGEEWRFDVRDGAFVPASEPQAEPAVVFAVAPAKVLAFGKGEPFSQTRYRF